MRGRIAAACAAVLVGLSPAGALPLASFAAAVAVSADSVAQRVETYGARAGRRPVAKSLRVERSTERAEAVRAPSIFRSPAGPAPSQAPPAA
ncbi:MAG TPA: hypothetical protein VII08_11040 [Myxococcales bacterium]